MAFASFYNELKNLLSIDFFVLLSFCSTTSFIILLCIVIRCNRINKRLNKYVDVLHTISISLSNNNEIVAFDESDSVVYATYPNLYSNKSEFIELLDSDISDNPPYRSFCRAVEQNNNCQVILISKDAKRYKKRFISSVYAQNDITVATLTDITKYCFQTDEIIRNHKKLEAFIDNLPVGIFYIDNECKILACNTTFANYLKTNKENLIGFSLYDFIEDFDLSKIDTEPIRVILKAKYFQSIQAFLIKPQTSLSFSSSQPLILVKTHKINKNDIESKIDKGQNNTSVCKTFEDSNIASVLTNVKGNIIHINNAFIDLIGNNKILSMKKNIMDCLHNSKEDLQSILNSTDKYLELPLKCYDDKEQEINRTVQLYVSHLTDSKENNILLQFIDITEQKMIHQQFLQSQKIQAIGQLASGIAHDFNNLLTAMIGFCDLLLQKYNRDDPPYGDISQIKQNANRAANLVKQLLAFSRQQSLNPQVISIKDTLLDMSSLLKRLLGPNISLIFNYSSNNDIWNVKVDNIQLEQVIMNLVVNARDAMHNKGEVKLQVRNYYAEHSIRCFDDTIQVGDYVLLEVIDNGCGMDQETSKHIFEPFFTRKIKDIKNGTSSGTGLGLATVYGIVKQTGGHINVKSEINKGTNFQIFLPRYKGNDELINSNNATNINNNNKQNEQQSDLSGYETILLVEDEDPVRNFISRALKDKGYNIIEARSGADALQIVNNIDMDLLITDVIMPKMDGPTLNKKLREIKSNFKTIFISGYTEDTFRENLDKDLGIYFMQKPFSLRELAIKVKEVLNSKNAKQ
ncbi:MAG: response regulator [Alphaproteobacteria bacterium]|nr:response regulator [Alphaproteobacteria bacterium]